MPILERTLSHHSFSLSKLRRQKHKDELNTERQKDVLRLCINDLDSEALAAISNPTVEALDGAYLETLDASLTASTTKEALAEQQKQRAIELLKKTKGMGILPKNKRVIIAAINHIEKLGKKDKLLDLIPWVLSANDRDILFLLADSGVDMTYNRPDEPSLDYAYKKDNFPLFALLLELGAKPTLALLERVIKTESDESSKYKKQLLNFNRFKQCEYDIDLFYKHINQHRPWDPDVYRYVQRHESYCHKFFSPTDSRTVYNAMKIGAIAGPLLGIGLTVFSSQIWLFAVPISIVIKTFAVLASMIAMLLHIQLPEFPMEILHAPFMVHYVLPVAGLLLYSLATACAFGAIAYVCDRIKTIGVSFASSVGDTFTTDTELEEALSIEDVPTFNI